MNKTIIKRITAVLFAVVALCSALCFPSSAADVPKIEVFVSADNPHVIYVFADGERVTDGYIEVDAESYTASLEGSDFLTDDGGFDMREFWQKEIDNLDILDDAGVLQGGVQTPDDYFSLEYSIEEGFIGLETYSPPTDTETETEPVKMSMYHISRRFLEFFLDGADASIIDWFACVLTLALAGGLISLIIAPIKSFIRGGKK